MQSTPYGPPPGYPTPYGAQGGPPGPHGFGGPAPSAPLSPSVLMTIALVAVALGAERFAYYGSRSLTYQISSMVGLDSTLSLHRVSAFLGIFGVVVGGGLGFALGARLTGVIGAVIALLGAVLCAASPGVAGIAILAFGCGVFRPVPLAVILEEIPSSPSPGRFRRVAASLAFAYLAVDVAAFFSSLFTQVGTRFGVRPALVLVAAAFVLVAVLLVVLLAMGPRKHIEADTLLEVVRGPDGAPYRGAPTVRAVGPALPLGLLAALLGAYATEVVSQGVAYHPEFDAYSSVVSMGIVRGIETFVGIGVSLGLGLVLATTELRVRSVYLFAGGIAIYALGALLRIPFQGIYPIVVLFGFVIVVGQSIAMVAGISAFASRVPKRFGTIAVAIWSLVATTLPTMMGLLPAHGFPRVAAGLAALLAVSAAGLLFVFGKQLQPDVDP